MFGIRILNTYTNESSKMHKFKVSLSSVPSGVGSSYYAVTNTIESDGTVTTGIGRNFTSGLVYTVREY